MFKTYTGYQYLLIDVANYMGHDKLNFEDRIQWTEDNLHQLEDLADEAEKKPLYLKAVQALRKAQRGEATGHMVAFDAVCSGMQLMSVVTGCVSGAYATGLVDPHTRMDAYTVVTDTMGKILGNPMAVLRKDAKKATMTVLYGSRQEPKNIFGDGTPELQAFYKAMFQVAPGACQLLDALLGSWRPFALQHAWVLPDGYEAKVKVMETVETRIEIDELDHATFTYQYQDNVGSQKGLSNVANVVHSLDAYVLRSLIRRCNYKPLQVETAMFMLVNELTARQTLHETASSDYPKHPIWKYIERWQATRLVDPVVLPYLDWEAVQVMPTAMLEQLHAILTQMLQYSPFPVMPVHDQFAAHANNVNWVRYWYKEILAELADSSVLDDILSQLYQEPCSFTKLSPQLSQTIRNSNYALS